MKNIQKKEKIPHKHLDKFKPNGTVTVDKNSASAGSTVRITVTPDKGFTLETLTVLDKNGKEIKVTNLENNNYSFTMPSENVSISATFMEDNSMLNFCVDVKADDYYYDAVLWAYKNNICSGVDDSHFAPQDTVNRAQTVTFLWRAAGCPEPSENAVQFRDVKAGSYYEKAVAWAVEKGITLGTGDNYFSPNTVCTRAQIVAFLSRFAGAESTEKAVAFTDVQEGSYYEKAVAWAVENGITEGTSATTFSPKEVCSRAQTVTFLYRLMTK